MFLWYFQIEMRSFSLAVRMCVQLESLDWNKRKWKIFSSSANIFTIISHIFYTFLFEKAIFIMTIEIALCKRVHVLMCRSTSLHTRHLKKCLSTSDWMLMKIKMLMMLTLRVVIGSLLRTVCILINWTISIEWNMVATDIVHNLLIITHYTTCLLTYLLIHLLRCKHTSTHIQKLRHKR